MEPSRVVGAAAWAFTRASSPPGPAPSGGLQGALLSRKYLLPALCGNCLSPCVLFWSITRSASQPDLSWSCLFPNSVMSLSVFPSTASPSSPSRGARRCPIIWISPHSGHMPPRVALLETAAGPIRFGLGWVGLARLHRRLFSHRWHVMAGCLFFDVGGC